MSPFLKSKYMHNQSTNVRSLKIARFLLWTCLVPFFKYILLQYYYYQSINQCLN